MVHWCFAKVKIKLYIKNFLPSVSYIYMQWIYTYIYTHLHIWYNVTVCIYIIYNYIISYHEPLYIYIYIYICIYIYIHCIERDTKIVWQLIEGGAYSKNNIFGMKMLCYISKNNQSLMLNTKYQCYYHLLHLD